MMRRFLSVFLLFAAFRLSVEGIEAVGDNSSSTCSSKPFINGRIQFFGGEILQHEGAYIPVTSPVRDPDTGERTVIGEMAQMSEAEALQVLESAKAAWARGQGEWPLMSLADRVSAVLRAVEEIKVRREEIIATLVWEICKSVDEARLEFDRTMAFIEATVAALKAMDAEGVMRTVSGMMVRVRRVAIGIMLCLGPFNYPFNETYATLIPALLLGNVVVMKIPSIGGLAHMLTAQAFAAHLPPGVVNFITGSGRSTMGPLMASGDIDVLAFIGGSRAADALIKAHPNPHRLKVFLQLEGKNAGIVLPDADIATAIDQIVLGTTSFNGQRCTGIDALSLHSFDLWVFNVFVAIKLVFVHESVIDAFLPRFTAAIEELVVDSPWTPNVRITPLPEPNKPAFLTELIADAVAKGAKVLNSKGGEIRDGSLFTPAVVYPVDSSMRLWHEEQVLLLSSYVFTNIIINLWL